MQLWFSRSSGLSIREQLATQIMLGILSGELAPGARLPSTRELARRFHLHANTISAGYRQLERGNWVEFRKGSGIYVGSPKPSNGNSPVALDQLITGFLRSARELNAPLAEVRSRLHQWLELQPPDHFLLIEPEPQLARIVVAEIQQAVKFPVRSCKPEDYKSHAENAIPIAVSFSLDAVRRFVPRTADIISLQLRSAGESLARHLPTSRIALVGVASGWKPFLKHGRTMLIAAGFDPECLILRDTGRPGWQRGLEETAAVVCDTVTAEALSWLPRVLSFPLLSRSSLKEVRDYEHFILAPLMP